MNQKGFANIVLTVLVVILAGIAMYFAFVKKSPEIALQINTPAPIFNQTQTNNVVPPQTSTPANWKTFTSDLMGIEAKYPPKYYVVKTINNPGENTFTSVVDLGKESDKSWWGREAGGVPPYIQFIYHANRNNLSIAELSKNWMNSAGVTASCKNLTVVGENALYCSLHVNGGGELYTDMIFLKHNGAIYSFSAGSSKLNDAVHSDLLKILSTLRFLQ